MLPQLMISRLCPNTRHAPGHAHSWSYLSIPGGVGGGITDKQQQVSGIGSPANQLNEEW